MGQLSCHNLGRKQLFLLTNIMLWHLSCPMFYFFVCPADIIGAKIGSPIVTSNGWPLSFSLLFKPLMHEIVTSLSFFYIFAVDWVLMQLIVFSLHVR